MKIENLSAHYRTTAAYEKMYDGFYEARCKFCGDTIAKSTRCQMGEEGMNQALRKAAAEEHFCPAKPPLVER